MSQLSPGKTDALISAAKADAPSLADRARIRDQLSARLAAQPGVVPRSPLKGWAGGALGVGVAGVLALWLTSREAPPASVVAPPPVVATTTPPRASASDLSRETALLRAAQGRLAAGDGPGAMASLEMHAREFPSGILAEERDAARVLALCSLAKVEEARKEAASFVQHFPASPHLGRLHASCGFDAPSR